MGKSNLIYHLKQDVKNKYVMEQKIYQLESSAYPDGLKYSLVFIEPKTGKKVLMDNHSPKGHHYHLDEEEFDYKFLGIDSLVNDFKKFILLHFGEKI